MMVIVRMKDLFLAKRKFHEHTRIVNSNWNPYLFSCLSKLRITVSCAKLSDKFDSLKPQHLHSSSEALHLFKMETANKGTQFVPSVWKTFSFENSKRTVFYLQCMQILLLTLCLFTGESEILKFLLWQRRVSSEGRMLTMTWSPKNMIPLEKIIQFSVFKLTATSKQIFRCTIGRKFIVALVQVIFSKSNSHYDLVLEQFCSWTSDLPKKDFLHVEEIEQLKTNSVSEPHGYQ